MCIRFRFLDTVIDGSNIGYITMLQRIKISEFLIDELVYRNEMVPCNFWISLFLESSSICFAVLRFAIYLWGTPHGKSMLNLNKYMKHLINKFGGKSPLN